jgi:hypothetical protein
MNQDKLSRRQAMRSLVVLAAGSALVACKKESKELSCADAPGLSPEDKSTRTTLEYVDKTPTADKTCDGCQLFKPAGPDACGGCTVVKGPINPKGYCKSWVKKIS